MSFPSVRAEIGPGIYRVHKAVGQTSFVLVQRFMEDVRLAGIRRDKLPVCHGGALDPFAEGLVLLLAGEATRLMDLLHPIPKTYLAEIAWGAETDNGDPLGRVVERGDAARLTAQALEAALAPFIGWRDQVPPPTSNKRVGGERAYRKAHRGERFELPPSRVYLHEARWLEHRLPASSRLLLVTGGGYYVRALARDLGRATGARAHLSGLRRTAIGPWADPAPGERIRIHGSDLFPWLGSVQVSSADVKALRATQSISTRPIDPPPWPLPPGFTSSSGAVRIRARQDSSLVAIVRESGGALVPDPALRGNL